MSWPLLNFVDATPYQQIFDYAGSSGGGPVYVGWATCGVLTSQDKWKIQKLTYVTIMIGGTSVIVISQKQYANGDVGFTQIWDNRASLIYK